ncbi:putative nicotinate-nucleotide adenylyltransferase [compost metagenome]
MTVSVEALRDIKLETLPKLDVSPILYDALDLLDDPNVSVEELAHLISLDPQLAGQLVETTQGHSKRSVEDIDQAIKLMGMGAFTAYIAWFCAENELTNRLHPDIHKLLSLKSWNHSQQVAICSHLLAERLEYPNLPAAFSAGLFHDLGHSLLERFSLEELVDTFKLAPQLVAPRDHTEDMAVGCNHGYIASAVLEAWGLPPVVLDAVRHHHEPYEAQVDHKLTRIVHLADVAIECHRTRLPFGIALFKTDTALLEKMELSKDALALCAKQTAEIFSKAKTSGHFILPSS